MKNEDYLNGQYCRLSDKMLVYTSLDEMKFGPRYLSQEQWDFIKSLPKKETSRKTISYRKMIPPEVGQIWISKTNPNKKLEVKKDTGYRTFRYMCWQSIGNLQYRDRYELSASTLNRNYTLEKNLAESNSIFPDKNPS